MSHPRTVNATGQLFSVSARGARGRTVVTLVRIDDLGDKRVPNDVIAAKVDEADVVHTPKDAAGRAS